MKKKSGIIILAIVAVFLILIAGFIFWQKNNSIGNINNQISNLTSPAPSAPTAPPTRDNGNQNPTPSTPAQTLLTPPISSALSRVTKKAFGIYVSPGHSPVSPEKFSGYHTGVDFEILPGEENMDMPIFAACSGPLLLKRWVSGYGGVAVQQCQIASQDVTIIYGHLRLASIQPKIGDKISADEQFARLGTGYGPETDGERKHLHLGIHKGTNINLLGYVQNLADLNSWLDALKYLK